MDLHRLNNDTSWLMSYDNHHLILDPWLLGDEIDGFAHFNRQSLSHEPLLPTDENSKLYQKKVKAIVISQPFGDHCHEETLDLLLGWQPMPIYAVQSAVSFLKKKFPRAKVVPISPTEETMVEDTPIGLQHCPPPNILDPTHGALVISSPKGSIFYAPHGYVLNNSHHHLISTISRPITVISTTIKYELPFYLGGVVNLGLNNANHLVETLQAKEFYQTHSDAAKIERGFVKRVRSITVPTWEQVISKIPVAKQI